MRTIAILLLSFLSLSLAIGADVRWTYSDFTTTAQTVKKVYITPIASYGTNGNTIITGDRRVFTNDSAGSLIVSNLIVGRSYRVEFKGAYTDTVITNSFDSTVTGFVEAVNYIAAPLSDGGLTSYSKTAADARFHNVSGDTSTNAAFRGTFKIPAGASVGYVLTATNADGSGAWQVGASGTSGALTNNDTRNVTFLGTVASSGFQGDGNGLTELDADNLIYGSIPIGRISDGLITSNKLDAAAYVAFKNDVTQSGLAAGSVAVNGVAVTNQFSMIGLLQNMPRGLNKATGVYGGTQVTNSQNLVIAATGVSGIVRTLFIHPDVGSTGYLETNMNKLKLLVYADGNLTCDVYLSDLWGTTFQTGTNWSINRYTRYCDAMADGLSLRTGFPLYTMSLRVPMPFTNGITCKLTNYTTGTTWTHGYIAAEYETLTLPTELLHARTYITNIHGSISASASNILFGVSGKGEVIGVNIGLSNSISSEILGFQDSHGLGFVLDTYIYKPDGLDDWLNRTYGGAQGASIGYDVGTLDYSYDYAGSGAAPGYMESFRWLYSDALRFTNSISVYRDGQTSIDYGYFTFFYIRKP
jgi:hypothetical protein